MAASCPLGDQTGKSGGRVRQGSIPPINGVLTAPGTVWPQPVRTISRARRPIFPASGSTSVSRTRSSRKSTRRRGGSDGATQRPMALWRRNSAPGQRLRAMLVKRWPKIRSRCLFPATGSWRPAVRLAVFPRRAARRPRSACLRWRALISSRRDRLSNLWGSEMCALRPRIRVPRRDYLTTARHKSFDWLGPL
jgi:hypothetical protein